MNCCAHNLSPITYRLSPILQAMSVLTSAQRRNLEAAVKKARQVAERGAIAALEALAVHQPQPYPHLTPEDRALRNSLRAKARLLGDVRQADGTHQIHQLTSELAYEYWHSLLFASFLEANHLLIHPGMGVPVTLEECEELAPEEGFADGWAAAARYASHMLPAIFRVEDPLMAVRMATEDRQALEALLTGLERSIFTAEDALGWVYQFWQSEAKERINKSGDKIDGEKLPAVTQLFTEPYMVRFLIDNTIGAWWAANKETLSSKNKEEALGSGYSLTPPPPSEGDRGGGQFPYLRFKDDGTPAAGAFDGWPKSLAELTCLDPCMGSGHFISALFSTLAPLRMAAEGLSKEAATDAVITQNLHGLELDPRCTQIAAFNLALTAWKFCGRYRELPAMNLACSGIAPTGGVESWLKLLEDAAPPDKKARLQEGMRSLYALFQKAPELGSLLDPATVAGGLHTAHFNELQPYLEKALAEEAEEEAHERGVMAAGIAKAGALLAKKYVLQITNVPYLGRGKMAGVLADYCAKHYADAKADLATVFLDKMLKSAMPGGTACSVMPQNWLFLTTYKKLRERLLKKEAWNFVARLGPGAFSQISGEVVKAALISVTHSRGTEEHIFCGIDVSNAPNAAEKDAALQTAAVVEMNQSGQLKNPDAVCSFEIIDSDSLLNKYSYCYHGLTSGDLPRMKVYFWELNEISDTWIPFQSTTKETRLYGGLESLLRWQNGKGAISELPGARKDGTAAWGNPGILVSQIGQMPATLYFKSAFDNNTAAIIPDHEELLPAIWCFCASKDYNESVRKIDQSLAVTSATMAKIPFDTAYWQSVAAEKYPDGLPQPYSDDPTQWLFHGHPVPANNPLQVALARLAGYRWPAESDAAMELDSKARRWIAEVQQFDAAHSDADGILCIPALAGEEALVSRMRDYLKEVYDSSGAWEDTTIEKLLKKEGATARDLETWLRDEAFVQHLKVFGNRPFLWHIWDGRRDGFSALVNYHKLDAATLRKLIYTYLGDYLRQCEAGKARGESGADGRLLAAQILKEKLEQILEGESPYDIYVRWKSLSEQPIGWEPDLNDGVRLNIRPFMTADVLRKKPNIKWGVDRGKNADGSVRDNDVHLRLEEKRGGREANLIYSGDFDQYS